MLEAVLSNNLVDMSDILRNVEGKQSRDFLDAYVEVILEKGELQLYEDRLKRVLLRKRVSQVALYGYFLGGVSCQ